MPVGTATCHRLTGGQRSGPQGDQLGMRLPKVAWSGGGGVKRGASQTLHRIGETEARSSTGWPGSPSTRPLRPQGRPARGGLGPRAGPRLASPYPAGSGPAVAQAVTPGPPGRPWDWPPQAPAGGEGAVFPGTHRLSHMPGPPSSPDHTFLSLPCLTLRPAL